MTAMWIEGLEVGGGAREGGGSVFACTGIRCEPSSSLAAAPLPPLPQTFSGTSWEAPDTNELESRLAEEGGSHTAEGILIGPTPTFGAPPRLHGCRCSEPGACPLRLRCITGRAPCPATAGTMHSWECDPEKGPGAFKIAETFE